MAKINEFYKNYEMAFKLDKKSLEELEKIIKKFMKDLKIQERVLYDISLKNGEQRKQRELEELLSYKNNKEKEIVRLGVYTEHNSNSYIKISFSEIKEGVIAVNFSTDTEKNMFFYKTEIEDFLEIIKLRYSFLRKNFFYETFIMLLISVIFLILIMRNINGLILFYNGVNNFEFTFGSILLIMLSLNFIITKVIYVVFPKNNFCIGLGEERYKKLNWLRLTVLGTLISSIVSVFFN